MSKTKLRKNWSKLIGPFYVQVSTVRRGDGVSWTAYTFQIKPHTFQNAGPDRFTIRYETKIKD